MCEKSLPNGTEFLLYEFVSSLQKKKTLCAPQKQYYNRAKLLRVIF